MHGCVNLDTRGRVGLAVSPHVGQEGAAETCRGCCGLLGLFEGSMANYAGNNVQTQKQGYLRHAHPAVTRAPLYKEYLLYGTPAGNEVEHKKSVM